MWTTRVSRSTKLLLGGLAALLGVGATAQMVGASAAPVADDHTSTVDPSAVDPTTLESCTAMFGLYKSNSDLAKFDVQQTGTAPITPTPVVGTDLIPVVSITDGTTSHECAAVEGWTDQATFVSDYQAWQAGFVNGTFAYPGTGYFLIPSIDGGSLMYHGTDVFTPTSRTFTLQATMPAGHSLSWLPTAPVASQVDGYYPLNITLPMMSLPYFTRVFDAVQQQGSLAQRDYLVSALTAAAGGTPFACSPTDATFLALVPTLTTLLDGFDHQTVTDCGSLPIATDAIGRILTNELQVTNAPITVTIAGPPPTTTTSTTSTTSTSTTSTTVPSTTTTASSDPLAPAFAG